MITTAVGVDWGLVPSYMRARTERRSTVESLCFRRGWLFIDDGG
jgi:hypothetical protein